MAEHDEMSDDDALRLSADIYDGMLSEPSSPRSKLLGSFEVKTELSAAPGAVGEIRDHTAIAALVAERDALREALERLLPEAVNDRYVSQSPAVENARAALASLKGGA